MQRRSLIAATLAAPALARAQTLPDRDIRLVCCFPAGGTGDLFFRILAERLAPVLGRTVIVENRAGAVGMVAAEAISRMPPDGAVVVMTSMALYAVLPQIPGQPMPLDPMRDLTPVSNGCGIPNILVASPQSAFRTVKELIAAAKAAPGKLTFASGGTGSSQHLAGEMFRAMAGVDLLHVPYRGGAQAVVDLTAGRADLMFGNLPEFLGQIRGGTLRPLAWGGRVTSPLLPGLPRIADDVPDFEVDNWFGIGAPRDMPAALVAAWTKALATVHADQAFRQRLTENGLDSLLGTPEALLATIAADRARWGKVIREAGIRAG
jgi:tripartite-type tricarboxylate transporter receptor subunit TctC